MIQLRRLPCPGILERKYETWTEKYLARREEDPGKRPESRQYAHPEIKDTLAAMSSGKCFYCESKLGEDEYEVDHHIEIAEDPGRAFDWNNLYLACNGCQNKLPGKTIAVVECLDPCNLEVAPADHLGFEDEVIVPKNASPQGRRTIAKYKLGRGDLELKRIRQLKRFHARLDEIRRSQIADGGRRLTADERARLRRFAAPEHSYSLMFQCYLTRRGLLDTPEPAGE